MGENLLRLPLPEGAAAAGRDEIALTFDDGPDPEVTPRVLDLLDAAGARATFFCIGRRVEAHPEIAAEIARRGHRIENHTYTHPHLFACYLAPALRREIEDAQRAIERATGRRPRPLPGTRRPAQPLPRLGPPPRRPAPRRLDPPWLRHRGLQPRRHRPPPP